jgi:hypothetical protein
MELTLGRVATGESDRTLSDLHWLEVFPTVGLDEVDVSVSLDNPVKKVAFAKLVAENIGKAVNLTKVDNVQFTGVWNVFKLPFLIPQFMLMALMYSDRDCRPHFRGGFYTDEWMMNFLPAGSVLDDFVRACCVVGKSGVTIYFFDNNEKRLTRHYILIAELLCPTVHEVQELSSGQEEQFILEL